MDDIDICHETIEAYAIQINRQATEIDRLRGVLAQSHEVLHRVLTVFIPSNDGAHNEVSETMRNIRAALADGEGVGK